MQLIEDVLDAKGEYYIGSLIVDKKEDGSFEVIDGQQRLTALFLLLDVLGYKPSPNSLRYECRKKSNYTLENLDKIGRPDANLIEEALLNGRDIIAEELDKNGGRDNLQKRLKNVRLFRVEVPKNTDLNRYFEIMNTRGEQLEQHDIVKARLMGFIDEADKRKRKVFAEIWNACSDMDGYVQMKFKKEMREKIFGVKWNRCPDSDINLDSLLKDEKEEEHKDTISYIITQDSLKPDKSNEVTETEKGEKVAVRFESIIDFPYFLLHTLRVFLDKDDLSLDDKKLSATFKKEIDGCEDKQKFALNFIKCLLKTRYLFDNYIIKREYVFSKRTAKKTDSEDEEGEWSLKALKKAETQDSAQYKNTVFCEDCGAEDDSKKPEKQHKQNLMLQACLRVAYLSPKSMNWITGLLTELHKADLRELDKFSFVAKKIAQEPVRTYIKSGDYSLGVGTPHIVFHYLDYLLWEKDDENGGKNADFVFKFRNSVEHWYPQNPLKNSGVPKWNPSDIDHFGNLCIVHRSTNSKFSNLPPTLKGSAYPTLVEKGSLKLRMMHEKTKDNDEWRSCEYKAHGDEMIKMLEEDVQE